MATRLTSAKASVRISRRLTASSGLNIATPVIFPPGCAMLVTTPGGNHVMRHAGRKDKGERAEMRESCCGTPRHRAQPGELDAGSA